MALGGAYQAMVDDGEGYRLPPGLLARMNPGGTRTTQPVQQSNPFAGLVPTPGQLQGFQPANYSQFGAIPYLNPTYMDPAQATAAQANPADQQYYLNQFETLLGTSLAPQFQRAQQGLDQDLAARGIFSSGAGTQASNDLQNQELATMAGAMQPLVSQFAGYNQDTQMADLANRQQTNMANAGFQQDANQYNAGAANSANATNAGVYGNIVGNDEANYNAFLEQLMQYGMGLNGTLLGGYLGSFGANPSISGILSQGLAGAGSAYSNALQAGEANAGNMANIFGKAAGSFFPSSSGGKMVPTNTGSIYDNMNLPVIPGFGS